MATGIEFTRYVDISRQDVIYQTSVYQLLKSPDESGSLSGLIRVSEGTYLDRLAKKFLLEGKTIGTMGPNKMTVNVDKDDEEFFRVASVISPNKWGTWRKALRMIETGKTKREVLRYLKPRAVAMELTK